MDYARRRLEENKFGRENRDAVIGARAQRGPVRHHRSSTVPAVCCSNSGACQKVLILNHGKIQTKQRAQVEVPVTDGNRDSMRLSQILML